MHHVVLSLNAVNRLTSGLIRTAFSWPTRSATAEAVIRACLPRSAHFDNKMRCAIGIIFLTLLWALESADACAQKHGKSTI